MPLNPNSDLVGEKWLGSVPGLVPAQVATTLPRELASWTKVEGVPSFVVVTVVGGSPHLELPIRMPVYQVDCWAAIPGGSRPPWGVANLLAERIRDHVEARPVAYKKALAMSDKGDYRNASVVEAILRTEPRRAVTPGPTPTGDPASYARYMLDLELQWVVIP